MVPSGSKSSPMRSGGLGHRPSGHVLWRPMQEILDAIQAGASGDDIANLPIPESTGPPS